MPRGAGGCRADWMDPVCAAWCRYAAISVPRVVCCECPPRPLPSTCPACQPRSDTPPLPPSPRPPSPRACRCCAGAARHAGGSQGGAGAPAAPRDRQEVGEAGGGGHPAGAVAAWRGDAWPSWLDTGGDRGMCQSCRSFPEPFPPVPPASLVCKKPMWRCSQGAAREVHVCRWQKGGGGGGGGLCRPMRPQGQLATLARETAYSAQQAATGLCLACWKCRGHGQAYRLLWKISERHLAPGLLRLTTTVTTA